MRTFVFEIPVQSTTHVAVSLFKVEREGGWKLTKLWSVSVNDPRYEGVRLTVWTEDWTKVLTEATSKIRELVPEGLQ